jgi:hypothetical protein
LAVVTAQAPGKITALLFELLRRQPRGGSDKHVLMLDQQCLGVLVELAPATTMAST